MKETKKRNELIKELYFENYGTKQIAAKLQISESTVNRVLTNEGCRGKRKHPTLVGKKFGNLTVVKYIEKGRYKEGGIYHIYECKCVCGNIVYVRSNNLKRGHTKNCKSCKAQNLHLQFKIGKIPSWIKNGIKNRCKKRGLEVNVTDEYLWELYIKQDKKCVYTGLTLCLSNDRVFKKINNTASVDRIDSNKGYIIGNVQWVHKKINNMKNNMSDKEFISWCRLVVQHQK